MPLSSHRRAAARTLSTVLALATLAGAGDLGAQGAAAAPATARPRARDLGITFGGTPGTHDAITDVAGVEVGHATLIRGEGRLVKGKGPVRTGVTVVFPRGKGGAADPVYAATHALNGNGEMTGTIWIDESGMLAGPVAITNTHSVGVVRDALVDWAAERNADLAFSLPVVAETYDGFLNDINGFHVKPEHVRAAIDSARGGPVTEGSVGGGTGMVCHQLKGGIGTASRKLPADRGGWTVGVLVQCNYGSRRLFTVEGVPVGEELRDLRTCHVGKEGPSTPWLRLRPCDDPAPQPAPRRGAEGMGSIIVVVATDAPLLPHQLARIARRVPLAIGKMGGLGEDSSGDIFLAFSTAKGQYDEATGLSTVRTLDNERIDPLFEATVQATQEAILNSILASDTMTGADGVRIPGLPAERLVGAMRKFGRLK
jgi:L-aminopeptidase/D-esterase-like protein